MSVCNVHGILFLRCLSIVAYFLLFLDNFSSPVSGVLVVLGLSLSYHCCFVLAFAFNRISHGRNCALR